MIEDYSQFIKLHHGTHFNGNRGGLPNKTVEQNGLIDFLKGWVIFCSGDGFDSAALGRVVKSQWV